MNRITKALVLSVGGFITAAGLGTGVASADVTSTLTADGVVRTESAHYSQAPETVYPRGGCRYWEKSTVSNNQNALQHFHSGFAGFVTYCGGDGA